MMVARERDVKPYREDFILLGRAAGGVYALAPSPHDLDSTISISVYDSRLTPYLGDLADGGVIVDKLPCLEQEDFVYWVVEGPLLRERLPPRTKQGLFGGPPQPCEDARDAKGQYVSLDLWLDLWRELGARIGKRRGNYVAWEDGELQEIPPAECRWNFDS